MIENNTLASLLKTAPQNVTRAIQQASVKTGVDFAYLVQQAKAESAFNPDAKAKTSSATGLFQFIEKTWLGMVRDHGHKYGLNELAEKIDSNGRVSDKAARQQILNLRKDPEKASLFAAEFANENKRYLESKVGGDIGATELYFAHFLGAGGAAGFLKAMKKDPYSVGAVLFPKESAANKNVFFDSQTGKPRTLKEIYDFFDKKFAIQGTTEAPLSENRKVNHANTISKSSPPIPAKQPVFAQRMNDSLEIDLLSILFSDTYKTANFPSENIRNSPFSSGLSSHLRLSPIELLALSNSKLPF